MPRHYPPISAVLAARDGRLWVGSHEGEDPQVDIVLPGGSYYGTARLPRWEGSSTLVAARGDAVWALRTDPEGVESLVRLRPVPLR